VASGLMLVAEPSGSKYWVQRLVINGRQRDIGYGSLQFASLKEACESASAAKRGRGRQLLWRSFDEVVDIALNPIFGPTHPGPKSSMHTVGRALMQKPRNVC